MSEVLENKADKIGIVTVNRPKQLNSINSETRKKMAKVFEEMEKDNEVSVVLLKGTKNKAFIAGADVKEFSKMKLKNRNLKNLKNLLLIVLKVLF